MGILVRGGVSAMAMACALSAVPAFAQAAEGAAAGDDIIVTAQRRAERLEAVPMSVAAVSPEQIRSAGVTNVRDLSNVVTGFQLAASGTFPQPAIRGISSTVSNYFDNNVAVYVDGLYQAAPLIMNLDLPNISSVEVLKGPQGTLYGRNATGGAVLLNTLDPTSQLHAKAEVGYGRFNDFRANGYISGPLDEKVSVSLAGNIRRSDGYYKFASRTPGGAPFGNAAPLKQQAIRAKFKFDFSADFSAVVTYSNVYISDTRTNIYTPVENTSPTYLGKPGAANIPNVPNVYEYDPANIAASKQNEASLKLKLKTGPGTLQSITGYTVTVTHNRYDFDGTYAALSYSLQDPVKNETFQQVIDYNIDAIQGLNIIVGAMFVDGVLDGKGTSYGGTGANTGPAVIGTDLTLTNTAPYRMKKQAWAGYIDATWNIVGGLYLNAGGRYSTESLHSIQRQDSSIASQVRNLTDSRTRFSKFTPRASLRYEFDPRTSIYASYSQGFRSGNYNQPLPACVNTTGGACFQPARQEEVDAFEVGFKTSRPGFRFDMAGFYYNYRNLQLTVLKTVPNGLGGFIATTDLGNAPKAKIYGLEANVSFQPVENLTVSAGGTWLHARYGDNFIFTGTGVSSATMGINTNADPLKTYGNVSGLQNLSGLMMTRSPNFSGNISVVYRIPQGEGGWELATNAKYSSKFVPNNPSVWGAGAGVPASRQNEQRFVQGAYAQVNASVTWTHPSGNYYVRAWGNNLTDKQYRLNYNGSAAFGTYVAWSDPLTFGGTVGFKM